jgi:hypothetical protein
LAYAPYDNDEELRRHIAKYCLKPRDFIEHRNERGFTVLHNDFDDSRGDFSRAPKALRKLFGSTFVGTPPQKPQVTCKNKHLARERHGAGNARFAVISMLAVLKKLGFYPDVCTLVARAVYGTRFHYRWVIGRWRTYPYVWCEKTMIG